MRDVREILHIRLWSSRFSDSIIGSLKNRETRRFIYWMFAAILVSYAIATSVVAVSALRASSRLESIQTGGLSSDLDIRSVDDAIAETDASIERLVSYLTPITFTCSLLEWVPLVGDNCRTVDRTFNVYLNVSSVMHSLLVSSDEVKALVGQLSADGLDAVDSNWIDRVAIAHEEAMDSVAVLESGNENVVNQRWLLPPLRRSQAKVDSAHKDSTEFAYFVVAVTGTLQSGGEVAASLPDVFRQLTEDSAELDLSESMAAWNDLARQLTMFLSSVDNSVDSLPDMFEGSDLEQDLLDAQQEIQMFAQLSDSIAILLDTTQSAFDQADGESGSLLEGDGLRSMVRHFVENEEELLLHGSVVSSLVTELIESDSSSSFVGSEMTEKIRLAVGDNIGIIELIPKLPRLLDGVIGVEGTRRYLVLGQSPAEIRPAGGFTSSTWVLEFTDGSLSATEYIPVIDFDERGTIELLPPAPEPLAIHMDAAIWYLRDVGWSPDFLKTGELALKMSEIAGVDELDGVIFINQHLISNLVGAIGPIEFEGQHVDAGNVDQVIQEGTDAGTTGFLYQVFTAIVDGLSAENVRSNYLKLSKTFIKDLRSNDLAIVSSDSETASLLRELDWDGRFSIESHDAVAVFDSNVGWNKVDLSVGRQIDYRAEIDMDGSVAVSARSEYTNFSDPSESTCDHHRPPAKVEDSYSQLRVGCYWNYVRSYVPLGAYNKTVSALPIPSEAVAVRTGLMLPEVDTTVVTHDVSGSYVGGLAVVPGGETRTLDFSYQLPPGTADVDDNGNLRFELAVFVQAGIGSKPLHGEIVFPTGYTIDSAPKTVSTVEGNIVQIDLVLDNNYVFEFIATPDHD